MQVTNEMKWLFPSPNELFPFGQVQPKPKRPRATITARGLKTSAAAEYLGISPWKLRQLVYTKQIPVVRGRHWVFDVRDLDLYLERTKKRGA